LRNVDSTIVLTPTEQSQEIQYKGRFGDYDVFVHYGRYLDEGVEKRFLEPTEAMLMGKSIEGVRHFGAIKDLKAEISARQFFLKSWETDDPSHRYIMIQSAPLLVPYDTNATFLMKVA
ncbi:MAG: major capsid protein, partial [Pseudobdellovibrionaceae bacterium]|nr:major capsid protein [Pseudobdellovibrionaceae bacterium]